MEFDFAVGFVAEGGDVVAFVADDVAGLGGVEEHAEFDGGGVWGFVCVLTYDHMCGQETFCPHSKYHPAQDSY